MRHERRRRRKAPVPRGRSRGETVAHSVRRNRTPKTAARSARFARLDDLEVLRESLELQPGDLYSETGDALTFRRAGVQDSVLRKLRRGQYRVEAELDLHGLTVAQAKQALREFLEGMLRAQARCVRIVHGKGLRSGHRGPVIKNAVSALLQRTDAVLAFTLGAACRWRNRRNLRTAGHNADDSTALLQPFDQLAQRRLRLFAEPRIIHRLVVWAPKSAHQGDQVLARECDACATPPSAEGRRVAPPTRPPRSPLDPRERRGRPIRSPAPPRAQQQSAPHQLIGARGSTRRRRAA